MLLKVFTDVGKPKPVALFAKVFKKIKKGHYQIKYLSPTTERYNGKLIHKYEEDVYDIDDDSIIEYIKSDEKSIGYTIIDDIGFIKDDTDSDYELSESESEKESLSESVVDSDEEVSDQEDEELLDDEE